MKRGNIDGFIFVHVLGVPHRRKELLYLKEKYGCYILEDSCASVGICAERIALANAILNGKTPVTLAIVGEANAPLSPCGTCRQFMLDFAPLKVILANMDGDIKHTTANKLLPLKFERRKKQ